MFGSQYFCQLNRKKGQLWQFKKGLTGWSKLIIPHVMSDFLFFLYEYISCIVLNLSNIVRVFTHCPASFNQRPSVIEQRISRRGEAGYFGGLVPQHPQQNQTESSTRNDEHLQELGIFHPKCSSEALRLLPEVKWTVLHCCSFVNKKLNAITSLEYLLNVFYHNCTDLQKTFHCL